ncbi:MAG: WYL domain-containing protein [Acidobacteria bacterium]|nr:WYL domain-containing protein [Acidobacteriota bacterium]
MKSKAKETIPPKPARLIRLAAEIKTNPHQRSEELCRALGVRRSQFFEDCRGLARVGFEFEYDRKEQRYKIVKDIFIPVFDLTMTEVISLALAVRQLSAAGDHTLAWDAVQAIRKVATNAPEPAREILAHAIHDMALRHAFRVDPDLLNRLWQAQQHRRRVRMFYDDYSEGKNRWLLADVYMIYFKGRALYADAYLVEENRIAMLRISRIKQVELQQAIFHVRPEYNFHERHRHSFRVMVGEGKPQRVKIRFDVKTARYIREAYWHESQRILGGEDGGLILELTVSEPREVLWYLVFPWADGAEILEPMWLREEAANMARKLCERYATK